MDNWIMNGKVEKQWINDGLVDKQWIMVIFLHRTLFPAKHSYI